MRRSRIEIGDFLSGGCRLCSIKGHYQAQGPQYGAHDGTRLHHLRLPRFMVSLKARYLHSTTNLLLLKICPLTPSFKTPFAGTRESRKGGPSALATFNSASGDRLPG